MHVGPVAGALPPGAEDLRLPSARLGSRPTPCGPVRLARADIVVSARSGNLLASFGLYNSAEDVDRALDVLSG